MNPGAPSPRARRIGAIVAGAFVFVIGTAAALADPASHPVNYYSHVRPDDRAGLRGPNAPSFMSVPAAVRPDDRAGIHGAGALSTTGAPAATTAVRPDDRAGSHGVGAPLSTSAAAVSTTAGSGFHWTDAGIGAGTTVALILIGGGLLAVATRRRGPSVLHG